MEKPNIVLILMDDMGWKDLSSAGSEFYESPNIDALMSEGMKFDNAYASCPVCSPSRASLLSGKYPARLGLTDWIDTNGTYHPLKGKLVDAPYVDHLDRNEFNLARALKKNGYMTYHVGKWHLGLDEYFPEKQGFDINIAGTEWGHPHQGYFSPYGIRTLEDGPEGEYLTDRITDEAINLILKHGKEKPFFLNLWHYAVHIPIEAPEEYVKYFREKYDRLGLGNVKAFEEGELFPTTDKKGMRVKRRLVQSDVAYAAMILNLDDNIKRLVDVLKAEGIYDDTIIIFTSDNGGLATAEGSPTCNAPAREGKGWMFEGGARVPLSISYPRMIKKGGVSSLPVTSTDIYPTLLDLACLPLEEEQHVDGQSLKKEILENAGKNRPLFWHYPHYGNQGGHPGSSVLFWPWKLIEFFEDETYELYNLEQDLKEEHNLVDENKAKAEELKALLHSWQVEVCAKFPQDNKEWEKE